MPKFGKQLQAEVIPGWSEYYLDYKFLKKIVSSLASNRPASEAAALALGIRVRPSDLLAQPPQALSNEHAVQGAVSEPPILGQDDDYRGPDFQAHKAAFFFKLERELEKVCLVLFRPFWVVSPSRAADLGHANQLVHK